jgi:hypothetical protein
MSETFIFKTGLAEITTERKDPLGAIRWFEGRCYKYVLIRNTTATVAGIAGSVVAYEAEDGAENNVVVLDRNDADAKPIGAGVLQAAVAGVHSPQASYYGWIQIKGPATLTADLGGTPADGDTFMAGATDLAVTKFTNDDSTETNDGHPCGVINDDSAGKVICDFPF